MKRRGYGAWAREQQLVQLDDDVGMFSAQHASRRSPEDPGSGHHCNSHVCVHDDNAGSCVIYRFIYD